MKVIQGRIRNGVALAWTYALSSAAMVFSTAYLGCGYFVLVFFLISIMVLVYLPVAGWRDGPRRCVAGIAWGLAATWTAVAIPLETTLPPASWQAERNVRVLTSGLPWPGIRRLTWLPDEELNPVVSTHLSPLFDFGTQDWFAFLVNASLLCGLCVLLCRFVSGRPLVVAHGLGVIAAVVATWTGLGYLAATETYWKC